jgi:type IV pilus assembly protein PilY1
MVYFGTGKYLELMTDNTSDGQETQTFYGIWDNWEAVEPLIRGADADDDDTTHESLQKQEIELEQQQTFLDNGTNVGDFDVRTSTANDVDWSVQKGWYMDLIVKDPPGNQGERQVTPSVLRNNRIIFTTLLPSDDPCASGGDSWLMELDAFSGARLPYTPFDLNLDGVFDAEDYAELPADDEQKVIAVPASGVKSKVGITIGLGGAPRIITDGSVEHVYSSDSPDIPDRNPGKGDYGRQSWREL